MSLVRMQNKKSGVTYVYESTSYWDNERKQPRSMRRLIGKIDPETGAIVPTGKRGRQSKEIVAACNSAVENAHKTKIAELEATVRKLKEKIWYLENESFRNNKAIEDVIRIMTKAKEQNEEQKAFQAKRQEDEAKAFEELKAKLLASPKAEGGEEQPAPAEEAPAQETPAEE